jgi:ketosteroid isomerase-like protein
MRKKTYIECAGIVVLCLIVLGCTGPRPDQASSCVSTGDDVAAVRQVSLDATAAYRLGDVSSLERSRADDDLIILPNGATRTKEESSAAMRGRKGTIDSFELSANDSVVHVCGGLAVETGIEHLRAHDAEGQQLDARYRYTVVYMRRDGRWQEIVDQATRIQ